MLAGGIALMIVGVIGYWLGSSLAYVTGGGLGLGMIGAALFGIGVLVAIAGAITKAVDRSAETTASALRTLDSNLKAGIESLWKQLDSIRQQSGGAAAPVRHLMAAEPMPDPPPSAPGRFTTAIPTMGYCPGCRKLRATNVTKCVYCGDAAPPLAG